MPNKQEKYAEVLAGFTPPEGLSKEAAWEKLQARLADTPVETTPVVKMAARRIWQYAAAAAVAAVVVVSVMVTSNGTLVEKAANIPTEVTLPDGSTVILNDYASVSFNPDTWEEVRELTLTGEAFFQVQKGSKFTVHTAPGDVQVLGTSFNVNAESGVFVVDCFTGKVAVSTSEERLVITPGQRSVMASGQLAMSPFDPQSNDWQAGVFHFEDCSLGQVCASLEKAYDVRIDASSVSSLTIDIDVDTKVQTLDQLLEVLCAVKGLSLSTSNNTFTLSPAGK